MTCNFRWTTEGVPGDHVCGLDKHHWPQDHRCWAFTGEPGDGVRCGVTSKMVTVETLPMWRLIVAEQARARRLHPTDHAGHPDNEVDENLETLMEEVDEVESRCFDAPATLAWELIQVAGVAAAWAEQLITDNDIDTDDLMALI